MDNNFSEKDYCTISLAANDPKVIAAGVTSFEGLNTYVKNILKTNATYNKISSAIGLFPTKYIRFTVKSSE